MISAIVCTLIALLAWRLVRALTPKSPLDIVPGPIATSFLTGHLSQITDTQSWDFHSHIAEKYGPIVKLRGLLGKPMLYIFDPLSLQHILKDNTLYDEPPWYLQSNCILLGPGLPCVTGETHRKQRKMLTPIFAPKHLRSLVPVFYGVTHKLVSAISTRVGEDPQAVDVLGWMGRAALELIGQSGLGYSFDPLTEDVQDAYGDAVKSYSPVATCAEMMLLRQLTPFVGFLGPSWLRRWLVEILPIPSVQELIRICDTMRAKSSEILQAKKAAVDTHGADHKDIISVLLKANMEVPVGERLPDEEVSGQMSSILFAAMDTTSTALSRILHLLAQHQEVQEKARLEVIEARTAAGGDLDYDQLHALPYLDAVCRETLRLYPPAPQTFRGTTKDAVLPLSQPIHGTDGSVVSDLVIPRGTDIVIGMMACNRSKALWGDDAYEWKPERWLGPLPETVERAAIPGVYSHLMTFLGGGRSCIGFTFSQLEMKVVLSELLGNFVFEPSDRPVFWNISGVTYPSTSIGSTKSELWLNVKRR
ncbi:cytochrome P450 [Dichomitus squalens LYAD-421 SS1]|uniref:Cytochrome P450 n=1 Tax=Dichomitus squalens (strain LYAD-421) TaxID=732165 RepID=R7SSD1_DICSQ|nr:cytochrome P450 [Dichomitus squalens LYAD-421 SS1]EJF59099.1 cytochrome P450 [Dichomitus squalens LYAD-421 SS1]